VKVEIIDDSPAVEALARRLAGVTRLAIDVESNGLFVYRPRLCAVQVAFEERGELEVVVIDTLSARIGPLSALLGGGGPPKVLHDLTFDARMLLEHGVVLGNVRDTSVAGRLLGRPALGLGSLAEGELGIKLAKAFQQHDWAERPLTAEQLAYLAGDVAHLFALDERLSEEVAARGVAAEVAEETAYKLAEALAEIPPPPPMYLRVKGLDRLPPPEQAIVRRASLAREQIAQAEDVPPFKVVPNDFLVELARRRPASPRAVWVIPGANRGRGARHTEAWAAAVRDGALPPDEAALLVPRRVPPEAAKERKGREERLRAWRKRVARERGIDEQAVLPGHCVNDLVSAAPASLDEMAVVPGVGAFRLERYGDAMLEALRGRSGA
jgi:ribonuclease D